MSAEITVMFDQKGKMVAFGRNASRAMSDPNISHRVRINSTGENGPFQADDGTTHESPEDAFKHLGYTFSTIDLEKTLEELELLEEAENILRNDVPILAGLTTMAAGLSLDGSYYRFMEQMDSMIKRNIALLGRLDKLRAAKDDEGVE